MPSLASSGTVAVRHGSAGCAAFGGQTVGARLASGSLASGASSQSKCLRVLVMPSTSIGIRERESRACEKERAGFFGSGEPLRRLAAACSASRTRATAEKWALTRLGVIPNVSPSRSDSSSRVSSSRSATRVMQ